MGIYNEYRNNMKNKQAGEQCKAATEVDDFIDETRDIDDELVDLMNSSNYRELKLLLKKYNK